MSNPADCNTDCCATPATTNIPGIQGQSAFSTTGTGADCFTVPILGGQVTVQMTNTDWLAVGQTVFIETAGLFTVDVIVDSTHATLTYVNTASNTASGNSICGQLITCACTGADGADGINAFTVVGAASPNTPAKGSPASIPVANSSWISVGQYIFVEGSGYYLVTAKADTTHFTGTYLDTYVNSNSGNPIIAGSGVSAAGPGLVIPVPEVDFINTSPGSINTPSSGVTAVFVDPVLKVIKAKDDAGFVTGSQFNLSTAQQAPAATVRTYITGSKITVPANKLQIGTILRWKFNMAKTGAGSAASTIDIAFGTAGTAADTARVSFTKPAGTAVIDEAFCEVIAIVRGPLSAAGVVAGEFTLIHNLAATGHATIPCVAVSTISAGFDVTTANLFVGLCITTGAADVITIELVQAEAYNL